MTIRILYTHYLNEAGSEMSVGGIQTYLRNLAHLLLDNGFSTEIIQSAEIPFLKEVDGVPVIGVASNFRNARSRLLGECKKRLTSGDVVIFGTDSLSGPVDVPSIAIQHGVSWDTPNYRKPYIVEFAKKSIRSFIRLRRLAYAETVICVDYNFINWARAVSPRLQEKLVSIPNFAEVPQELSIRPADRPVRIIFARRFYWYRGTRVFADAIDKVLDLYGDCIEVIFAGEGQDEAMLRERFSVRPNVSFIRYSPEESMNVHSKVDISVIPTVGSEGTSLSLLEAMASGCAVICTDVGGMTNVVLDGFNGIVVSAGDSEQLFDGIVSLIDDALLRKRIAINAYETVKASFSYSKWALSWLREISKLCK